MAPEIDEGEGEGLDVLAVLAEFQTHLTDVELARDMLRQRNQQLQMQPQQLQQPQPQLPPQPQQVPVAPAQPDSRAAAPDTFDGTRSKASSFRTQLTLYFMQRPCEFVTDERRITFALGLLRGTAGKWAEQMVRRREHTGTFEPATFTDWLQVFDARFGDSNPQMTSVAKMEALVMQPSQHFDEFLVEFEMLEHDTGFNDRTLYLELLKKLPPRITKGLQTATNLPATLDGLKEMVRQMDNTYWLLQQVTSHSQPAPRATQAQRAQPASPGTQAPPLPTRQPDVVPMDVDTSRGFRGACYKCGGQGHRAHECPLQQQIRQMQSALDAMTRSLVLAATPATTTPIATKAALPDFRSGP